MVFFWGGADLNENLFEFKITHHCCYRRYLFLFFKACRGCILLAVNLFYCNVEPYVVTRLLTFGREPSVINAAKCLAELKPSPVETSAVSKPQQSVLRIAQN